MTCVCCPAACAGALLGIACSRMFTQGYVQAGWWAWWAQPRRRSGTCGACPSSCHGNSKDGGGTRQACAQREPSLLTSLAHHLQCIAFLARSLIRCQYAPAPRRVLRSPAACGVRLPVGELAWPLAVTGWAESAVLGSQAAVQQGTRVMLLLLLLALLQTLAAFQCTCQAGAVVGRHSCCLTSHHLLLQRLAPPHAFILVRTRHRRCWLVALALASWARPTTWFRRISARYDPSPPLPPLANIGTAAGIPGMLPPHVMGPPHRLVSEQRTRQGRVRCADHPVSKQPVGECWFQR